MFIFWLSHPASYLFGPYFLKLDENKELSESFLNLLAVENAKYLVSVYRVLNVEDGWHRRATHGAGLKSKNRVWGGGVGYICSTHNNENVHALKPKYFDS